MEHDGKNPRQLVVAIIPARYASIRLPGKMLLLIAGKPLILHTLEQAKKASNVDRVIVATDDERIFDVVTASGNEVVMTSPDHQSGSDRLAEVAKDLPEGSIIVNVQGDEPLISPETIERAVDAMTGRNANVNERASAADFSSVGTLPDGRVSAREPDIVTVSEPITSHDDELVNFNVVKVVTNDEGQALYFSRSPMPFPREASNRYGGPREALEAEPELFSIFRKHTGLYVYRREYLLKFTAMPQTKLEKIEMLEQLRALENGAYIKVIEAASKSIGVDTAEDLERVRSLLEARLVSFREATENDLPAVSRVYVESVRRSFAGIEPQSYLDGLSAEQRQKTMNDRFARDSYHLFVAEKGDGIVGFIDCGEPLLDDLPHERQIFSFYLLPEFQRKGIGSRLFKMCAAQIVEEGCGSLCLDTLEASPYRMFYEKLGGSVVGNGIHRIDNEDFSTVIYGWDNLQEL